MYSIGIVGGGKGGLEVLNLIRHCASAKAAFVCDSSATAAACIAATKYGVPVFTELSKALEHPADYIFDLTGSKSVQQLLEKEVPNGKLVHGDLAYLLFSLVDNNLGEDDEDTLENRYLTFKICSEEYAIPVQYVKEIVGVPKITHIPEMPAHVRGTVNLRGMVFPVIDMRMRFGFPEQDYSDRTCVILIELGSQNVGFIVDEVRESVEIVPSKIEKTPRIAGGVDGGYVRGIGKDTNGGVKIMIDVDALLTNDHAVQQLN